MVGRLQAVDQPPFPPSSYCENCLPSIVSVFLPVWISQYSSVEPEYTSDPSRYRYSHCIQWREHEDEHKDRNAANLGLDRVTRVVG